MKNSMNWFGKKKVSIDDCSAFEIDKQQSDKFFGGFKEYVPPIYEHESAVKSGVTITDLFAGTNENK